MRDLREVQMASLMAGLEMQMGAVIDQVARQVGVKRVAVHGARGRLIAGFVILARAWL